MRSARGYLKKFLRKKKKLRNQAASLVRKFGNPGYKVEDDGTLVLTGTVRSSGLSQNADLVVAFAAGGAFDGLPAGQKVAFKVVKSVTVEGSTETVTSNVAMATILNP